MVDMNPAGALFVTMGAVDFVLQHPGDFDLSGSEFEALVRWMPLGAHDDVLGWYDRARETLGDEAGPELDADNLDDTLIGAVALLLDQGEAIAPARQLYVATAAMRARPDLYRNDEDFSAAVNGIIGRATDNESTAAQIAERYLVGIPDLSELLEEWTGLLDLHDLLDKPLLARPPCQDKWVTVNQNGSVKPAVKLTTNYDLANITAADVCDSFLNPATWSNCYGTVWTTMSSCDATPLPPGPKTFIEEVQINGELIVTCLQFVKTETPNSCILQFDLCDQTQATACAGVGVADGKVTIDHGYIRVTETAGGVHIKSTKTLRFKPPLDGLSGAMLACTLGYGAAGLAMASSCSIVGGSNS